MNKDPRKNHGAALLMIAALNREIANKTDALQKIADLDPSEDSEEGYNEWGEADCFNQAKKIANEALK